MRLNPKRGWSSTLHRYLLRDYLSGLTVNIHQSFSERCRLSGVSNSCFPKTGSPCSPDRVVRPLLLWEWSRTRVCAPPLQLVNERWPAWTSGRAAIGECQPNFLAYAVACAFAWPLFHGALNRRQHFPCPLRAWYTWVGVQVCTSILSFATRPSTGDGSRIKIMIKAILLLEIHRVNHRW